MDRTDDKETREEIIAKLKLNIHAMANKLQTVLSYVELDRCQDALPYVKDAVLDLGIIAQSISRLSRK